MEYDVKYYTVLKGYCINKQNKNYRDESAEINNESDDQKSKHTPK